MARQALTIIGAVVGAYFGGPQGAQIGMAIGAAVGGLVDPEVIKVPSVRDAAQQSFNEGAPIALYDGTCGGSGTLVYCSEPDYVTVRERQGKGGPVVESERAYITFAILIGQALQDGPGVRNGIANLIKVWEDDKLVYDVSPTSQILAESAEYANGFTFYPGNYTQLPDPDLEALLGATNCVAYRGRCMFVRKRYDATDRRLTPPNYKFEVTNNPLDPVIGIAWDTTPGEFAAAGIGEFQSDDLALYAEYSGGTDGRIRAQSVAPLTGKRYFEVVLEMNNNTAAGRFYIGFQNNAQSTWPGAPGNPVMLSAERTDGSATILYPVGQTYTTPSLGWSDTTFGTVRIRMAIDVDTRQCWFGNADGWFNGGDPAAGTGGWFLQNTGNDVYLYGDLNNITAGKQRRLEVLLPEDHDWLPPAGFDPGPSGNAIAPGQTTLESIVLAAGRRCGLADSEWSLPGLDEVSVRGVVVASQQYTGQDLINGLRVTFPSDGACFGGKIHILLRGGDVDFELDDDFRVEEGSDAEQDEVLRNGDEQRKAQLRRPAKINLMFPNANLGYTFTKANAPNYGAPPGVVTEITMEVPCVLDEETEAPQLADILDKISRAEADGEVVRVFPDYLAAKAVPGSIIRLTDGTLQRRLRVQGIRTGDGTRRLSMWADRQHAYVSQATAPSSAGWPTPPPSLPGETVAAFFNLPVLVDENDRLGVYAAISGQPGTAWTGAKIEWRVQGFTTWEDLGTFTQRAIMGTLLEALPGASPYWPDWTNPLRVRLLRDDDLESLSELEWLSEQGALAIRRADGTAEIVQSQFAVNDSGQDWTLTNHQRGRLDTDSTTAHAAGARVVVLDGCIFLPLPSSAIGKTLEFRVTSIGSSPETAPTFTLPWRPAISQQEWTVSGLIVERAGGLITGSWSPRSRLGTDANPVPSANLDGYQITLTDGTTTRTVTTATPVLSESDAAFSGPVTVTVKAINRWTGPGPGISRTV